MNGKMKDEMCAEF